MCKILTTNLILIASLVVKTALLSAQAVGPDEMLRSVTPKPLTGEMRDIEKEYDAQIVPRLYGGRAVNDGEIMPSVYIGNCTATIVGPKTLITAGHCRATGDSVAFTYAQTRYSGNCRRHPDYDNGPWLNNDMTLCNFDPEISLTYFGDLAKFSMKPRDEVTMQGYGAGSNGRLNQGTAVVLSGDDMEYVTKGAVALGGGDSGGALFAKLPDLISGPFNVVGINSRGGSGYSYFNRTDLARSQEYFKGFAERNSVKICGVNWDCNGANDRCPEERAIVEYFTSELAFWKKSLDQCLRAPTKFKFPSLFFK